MQTHWYALSPTQVLKKLDVSQSRGLSESKIPELVKKFGWNTLPEPRHRGPLAIFSQQFLSPLIYLLIFAALASFILGDVQDSIVIVVVVLVNALIGAVQEQRAEQSMKSLRKLSSLKARVLRAGQELELEASDLVPGDIIKLFAGDGVPSDARLLESSSLMAAEASLTGESLSVEKSPETLCGKVPLMDQKNMVFAGTHITAGRAVAVVVATGANNHIGQIAHLTGTTPQLKTALELKVERFGRSIAIAAVVLFFLMLAIGLIRGITFTEIFMISVSQMVSLVPEGLPVALTIALAVGVQRMARRKTLVRQLSAVESLGSTSVICTDKTGTLTKNEMTVVSIFLQDSEKKIDVMGVGYDPKGEFFDSKNGRQIWSFPGQMLEVEKSFFLASVCCNDARLLPPSKQNKNWSILGDPTEAALLVMAKKASLDPDELRELYPRKNEIPFDSGCKLMATQHLIHGQPIVFIKGALEAILPLCNDTSLEEKKILFQAEQMAKEALRVLAIGMAEASITDSGERFSSLKGKIKLLGLVGQLDPPREEVGDAIADCFRAGIRPIMLTGDHKTTGVTIAQKLGIFKPGDEAVDGVELSHMDELELHQRIPWIKVFARVQPQQKLRIVRALQSQNEVVAMTGDGVNDAPALMQANVGVAMGITGTEVAKEASKIIITDDNFSTIVSAVAEGRLVYQNIKKLILFLFVTSIDEIVVLFLAIIGGYPPPLAAVQILWINIVSEAALTVNLILEPAEGTEMRRPPVPRAEALIDRSLLFRMPLMVGASVLSTFGWFVFRTHQGGNPQEVQTEVFTMLVVCQWFNVLNCRSAAGSALSFDLMKNPWLVGGLILANALHFLVVYWVPLGRFFHTTPIPIASFFQIGFVASLVLWAEELRKYYVRRRLARNQ